MPADTPVTEDNLISLSPRTNSESQPFIGQWNQLVSTTNWDKGAIICQWRESLEQSDVPAAEYSDEAWSQLVGGVTPQHVGRLRRTSQRFGNVFGDYEGVYWSHFYAALDWEDAEMWLEGAVQNRWSVSAMRKQRWETLGKVGESPEGEIVSSELTEETQSLALSERPRNNDRDYVQGPVHEGPDWGDADAPPSSTAVQDAPSSSADVPFDEPAATPSAPHQIRPFESFDNLPEDVQDAATAFKIAIIRHKAEDWEAISREDLLGLLDALKQLATLASE